MHMYSNIKSLHRGSQNDGMFFCALVGSAVILFLSAMAFSQSADTLWMENWEAGIGSWSVSNGVWEAGRPTTSPPGKAHSGQRCAGTDTNNYYPANANTRLISSSIILPEVLEEEELQLRFWHWFNLYPEDTALVQISLNDGGNWETISIKFDWNSNAWTHHIIDISSYANTTLRFAFYFTSNGSNHAYGWFIDDISIIKGVFASIDSESFEQGIGDWYAEKGVWEVGVPIRGPSAAHSPPNCAGTVLGGAYPGYAKTRLISREITLTPKPDQKPTLCFWHWFNIYDGDTAVVQISVERGPWVSISENFGPNSDWTQYCSPYLSAYIDSTVRFAFYFTSNESNHAQGWFIDDIRIEGIVLAVRDQSGGQREVRSFGLSQNFPNPFNPSTTILYGLPRASEVEIAICNLLGEKIRILTTQQQAPGQHRIQWDGLNDYGQHVRSGVYLYRLKGGEFEQTRKMILLR